MRTMWKEESLKSLQTYALHQVDLKPIVEEFNQLSRDPTFPPEEIYREFLQRVANMVGSLVGKARTGMGNMANAFRQGYQSGRGRQWPVAQQRSWTGQEQNPYNRADENEGPLNEILHHLQQLKKNIELWFQQYPELSKDAPGTTEYIDKILQILQQVLYRRYGGVRSRFTPS